MSLLMHAVVSFVSVCMLAKLMYDVMFVRGLRHTIFMTFRAPMPLGRGHTIFVTFRAAGRPRT